MKNSALAPILLLLALLVLAWGGLFGLSHATTPDRTEAARAHPTGTTTTAPSLGNERRDAGTNRTEERVIADREAGFAPSTERLGEAPDRADVSDRTSDRTTTASGATETRDGAQESLDRMSYQTTTAPAARNPDDSSGLSGRGAAALIIVLLLVLAGSRK